MAPIRVQLADDHPPILEGLKTILGSYGIETVATASTASDVIPQFEQHRPDVLVLDVRFGEGQTGLDVLRTLLASHAGARVVIYTQYDQDELVSEAYEIGCAGFVTKDEELHHLADAIREAHAGNTFFLKRIAERLALRNVRKAKTPEPLATLDARELAILKLLALGKQHAEIAATLELSLKTISNLVPHIKDKLGLHRPAEIALFAVRNKLIEP
jgi:two-component system invasion response regulator UvrY